MAGDECNWTDKARLFLVLDEEASQPRTLDEVTRLAVIGGVDAVLLRMIDAGIRDVLSMGRTLLPICKDAGVPFVLSHNPTLSQILHPDGVHLGKRDIPIPDAKRVAPRGTAIGYSSHSLDEARSALELGADYVFLGPIFSTPKKLAYGLPLGLGTVKEVSKDILPKVVFIGGIDEKTLPELLKAGGRRIAVIRAICSADDITSSTIKLKSILEQYPL